MPPNESDNPDRQNQDTYEDLLTAIESGQGSLSLLIAVCDDPVLREELIRRYESELAPEIQSYRLTLTRGEPSLSAAVRQTIESHEYLQQGKPAVLTLTGIELLHFLKLGKEKSEQETFFGYLQWTREALREFSYPIVIWLTYQNLTLLSRKSPDFWSWRKGVFRFMSRRSIGVPAREFERLQILDFSGIDEETLIPLEDLKALIQQTEQTNPKDPILATLYSEMGRILVKRLDLEESLDDRTEYIQAIEYLQKAIGLQEEQEPSLDLSISLNNLAYLYDIAGQYQEAEPLYDRALSIDKQLLGAEHSTTASTLNNLALLYASTGRYEKAEQFYHRALNICQQQKSGVDIIAAALDNLAGLYREMERYEEAEQLYHLVLKIDGQRLDKPLRIINRLNNFAALYHVTGRHEEAEQIYIRTLNTYEQRLGANHPAIANTLNSLAILLFCQMGHYEEAEPLLVQSLAIREQQLGADHPDTASSLKNLALLYYATGRYEEAEPLLVRSLTIYKQVLGTDDPDTVEVREHLETLRSAMAKIDRPLNGNPRS